MHEKIRTFTLSAWEQIKAHPWATIVTGFNVVVFLINSYSLSFLDYNTTRQQTYANTTAISQLSAIVSANHDSITILQQIAKDNAVANAGFATQLSNLNNNFLSYLAAHK